MKLSYAVVLAAGALIGADATANVLIIGANNPSWNAEVASKISGTGILSGSVDTFDGASATPSLATLQSYSSVLVYSDNGYFDNSLMGNTLADYVDSGGGVVEATFSFWVSSLGLGLGGRWDSSNYSTWQKGFQDQGTPLQLGTIHVPGSPILNGVTSFNGGASSYHNTVGALNPGATLIASYNDGEDFIAENVTSFSGRIVGLNFYPPSSDSRSDFWDTSTDGAKIMANALNYVSGNSAPSVPDSTGATAVPLMAVVGAFALIRRRA